MDERIRGNIELFRRQVPKDIALYVADKGSGADVFAPTSKSNRDAIDDAYEITQANTRYKAGFSAFFLDQKRLKPAVRRFLAQCEKI